MNSVYEQCPCIVPQTVHCNRGAHWARTLHIVARHGALSCLHCAYYARLVVIPARPCSDTRPPYHAQAWSQHQKLCCDPKRPNHVATSKLCRDTTSAHSEAFRSRHQKLCRNAPTTPSVVTPTTVLRHQMAKPCRNTEIPDLCCDTKNCVAKDLSSPRSFLVATPRPCRDTQPAASVAT